MFSLDASSSSSPGPISKSSAYSEVSDVLPLTIYYVTTSLPALKRAFALISEREVVLAWVFFASLLKTTWNQVLLGGAYSALGGQIDLKC